MSHVGLDKLAPKSPKDTALLVARAALRLANSELHAVLMSMPEDHPRINNVQIALDATAEAIAETEKEAL